MLEKWMRRLSYSSSQVRSMRISSGIASLMARFPRGSSHDWVSRVDSRPGRLPKADLDSEPVNHTDRQTRVPPIEAPSQPSPGRVKQAGGL